MCCGDWFRCSPRRKSRRCIKIFRGEWCTNFAIPTAIRLPSVRHRLLFDPPGHARKYDMRDLESGAIRSWFMKQRDIRLRYRNTSATIDKLFTWRMWQQCYFNLLRIRDSIWTFQFPLSQLSHYKLGKLLFYIKIYS